MARRSVTRCKLAPRMIVIAAVVALTGLSGAQPVDPELAELEPGAVLLRDGTLGDDENNVYAGHLSIFWFYDARDNKYRVLQASGCETPVVGPRDWEGFLDTGDFIDSIGVYAANTSLAHQGRDNLIYSALYHVGAYYTLQSFPCPTLDLVCDGGNIAFQTTRDEWLPGLGCVPNLLLGIADPNPAFLRCDAYADLVYRDNEILLSDSLNRTPFQIFEDALTPNFFDVDPKGTVTVIDSAADIVRIEFDEPMSKYSLFDENGNARSISAIGASSGDLTGSLSLIEYTYPDRNGGEIMNFLYWYDRNYEDWFENWDVNADPLDGPRWPCVYKPQGWGSLPSGSYYWDNRHDVTSVTFRVNGAVSGEQVTVCIDAQARDLGGNRLDTSHPGSTVEFTSGGAGVDTEPPVITWVSPADGQTVSGTVPIQLSANDNVGLSTLEVRADQQTVYSGGPQNGEPIVVQWDSTPFIGDSVVLTAEATDGSDNSTVQSRTVIIQSPQVDYNIEVVAAPATVNLGDSATITATITDGSGQPVEGVDVTFSRGGGTTGFWVDVSGNVIPSPGNGPTDALGRSRAYFEPTVANQNCVITACFGTACDTATFLSVPPATIDIMIGSRLLSIDQNSARYVISAQFDTSSGNPLDHGTAQFTTDFGAWPGGGSVYDDDIDTFGAAGAILTITQTGTATIQVCHLESGSCATQTFTLSIGDSPIVSSHYALRGPMNGMVEILAGGTDTIAALEDNRGLVAWDMNTLEQTHYFPESNYSADDWRLAEAIAISANDRKVVLSTSGGIGVFDLLANTLIGDDSPSYDPEEDTAFSPNGQYWIAIDDMTSDEIHLYQNTNRLRVVDSLGSASGTNGTGIDWSRDGTRVAYTYEDEEFGPSRTMLRVRSAPSSGSSGSVQWERQIETGNRAGGVAWSWDSQYVAAADNEGSVEIYTRNGSLYRTLVPRQEDVGSIAWTPDGTHVALAVNGARVAIFNVASSLEVARCELVSIDARNTDTLAWRKDGKVLFATKENSSSIHVFAPFDTTDPTLTIFTPGATGSTTDATVGLSGSVADDTAVCPGGLSYSVNGGQWQQIDPEPSGLFTQSIPLSLGLNVVQVELLDLAGNRDVASFSVERYIPPMIDITVDGEPAISGSTVIDLGTAMLGEVGPIVSPVISNMGGLELTLIDVSTEAPFAITNQPAPSIPSGGSDSATIRLTTDTPGNFENALVIVSNSVVDPSFTVTLQGEVIGPCNAADLALDFGLLDLADIATFVDGFTNQDPIADLNTDGLWDLADIVLFVEVFSAGCP